MNEKVSIGVPIYNVRKYIERCAISLFKQTYQNIEFLFVDDCTPDDSMGILAKVLLDFPHRKDQVKILSHRRNRGLAAARNTAVQNATGTFMTWVDSDDYIESEAIEKLVNKQKEGNYDIVSCDFKIHKNKYTEIVRQPDIVSGKDLSKELLTRSVAVSVWGRLIRLSLYKEHSVIVKEGINNGEDYQITPVLAFYAGPVTSLHEQLYHYDFTNETSFSFSFSETKSNQALASLRLLKDFFHDKGEEYIEALRYGEANLLARLIIDSCLDKQNSRSFISYRDQLNGIDKKYWEIIPLLRRFGFYLHNRSLVALYFRGMKLLKGGTQLLCIK